MSPACPCPPEYTLDVYRGDTQRWQFKFWLDAAKTVAADLTGVVPASEIRAQATEVLLATMTCTLTLPNIIDMVLPATQSKPLPLAAAFWDLELTYPSGDVKTPIRGPVVITADATQ